MSEKIIPYKIPIIKRSYEYRYDVKEFFYDNSFKEYYDKLYQKTYTYNGYEYRIVSIIENETRFMFQRRKVNKILFWNKYVWTTIRHHYPENDDIKYMLISFKTYSETIQYWINNIFLQRQFDFEPYF